MSREQYDLQHRNANDLYAYMTTLGNLPPKNERNKTTLYTRNDRKDRVSKFLSANQSSGAINDENTKPTGEKAAANNEVKSRVECYNCGKNGYIARKCRMPRVECDRCNRLGHRADKCTVKKDVSIVKGISDAKSNLYERAISVNGHKINGLVDTGSGGTLLRTSVVKKYNKIVAITSDNVFRGFAGQITTSNRSVSCEIKIMDATAQINAIVVPDEHLIYDIIVGRDFLEREDIVTIKRGNDLIFKQLAAIDDRSKNIIDINFFDVERKPSAIVKYTDVIREEARQQCTELLQHFRDCISFLITDLGKTDVAALNIRCTSDVLVVYRPYRLAESEKRVVRKMIHELLINNIIRKSSSPYASPILLVKKKNGENRMCVDFRKLNAITIKDKYPMPLIEEQIDRPRGNQYFTSLDLARFLGITKCRWQRTLYRKQRL